MGRCRRLACLPAVAAQGSAAMKKRVYIETTIPSFYVETRPEPDMVARRGWTREWWDTRRQHYDETRYSH